MPSDTMPSIRVQTADFDLSHELAAMRAREGATAIGAVASFIGLVRDVNEGSGVSSLTLEHYPTMTEKALADIVAQAHERWQILDCTIVHRVGKLMPTDQIVLVMVASAHRQHAFQACEFMMDFLKTAAPFWKKETTSEGERWVDARESDDAATQRWITGMAKR
jgi:molybdopterin synthase catalytic subunit